MFVKFDCGCIGLIIGTALLSAIDGGRVSYADDVITIKNCDQDVDDSLGFCLGSRDFSTKSFTPLDQKQVEDLAIKIQDLVHEGYRLRKIKQLLK